MSLSVSGRLSWTLQMWFLHWNLIELLLPVSESSPSQGTGHVSVTGKLISWQRGGDLYDRGGGDAVIESETLRGHHSQIWTCRFLWDHELNAFDVYLLFNNATPLPEWFSDCCINTGTRMAIHISIAINQIFNFHRSQQLLHGLRASVIMGKMFVSIQKSLTPNVWERSCLYFCANYSSNLNKNNSQTDIESLKNANEKTDWPINLTLSILHRWKWHRE